MPDLTTARPTRRQLITQVSVAFAFAMIDLAICLNSGPTTGWAGPRADLVLLLVVDASLVLAGRFTRTVAGLTILAGLLTLYSDAFAPGLFAPVEPASPLTLPRIAPIVVIFLVQREPQRVAFPLIGLLALIGSRPWTPSWTVTPVGLLSTIGPAVVVLYLNARKELLQSLRDRAERAEREKHLLAEQARSEERRRLAAEMHDVLTHGLSLMVLQADALGVTSTDPAVRKAAKDIRSAGSGALDELRDLVGVLNSDPVDADERPLAAVKADQAPDPADPARESTAAGLPVELEVTGERSVMSPAIARTAHRIVQEALTNTRKHAPGAEVRVRLDYRPDRVSVRVRNSAAARPPDEVLAGSGSGFGLSGIGHRVDVIGGTLTAGPTGDGGFEVAARLPTYVPTNDNRRKPG
ncbi:sensor histidine kinase [Kibdelosporangium phytohabitans]|uniref:histidine kinase n=1 Tax=Kibdelosporangium phytohabitans TaxID=860235 RepID=A0A0N9HTM6_9PSEU|nr:histidine kinase [Kibdelosporangium phytohabitans]ALG10588.1 histidine kinase [Kibdelosporangium phytohabitans]MBE1461695.1 signal transduction histidine kinase [Kibdelosporangium phytohabitans]